MSGGLQKKNRKVIKNWREDYHAIEKYKFLHNFVPHPQMGTRAPLLSSKALTCYLLFVLLFFGLMRLIPIFLPGVLGYASNINIRDLYVLTNKKRGDAGLPTLSLNEDLSKAAMEKAEDMFEHDYWSHISPAGVEPWDFILEQGYDYSYAGENLAKNFNTSEEVVEAWFRSTSHKENLLSENYTEVGYAVVNGILDGYETTLVVQMFGKGRQPTYVVSKESQEKLLETLEPVAATQGSSKVFYSFGTTGAPTMNVSYAAKSLNIVLSGFLASLLSIDLWYSRRRGITKLTGHTLAHLALLLVVFIGFWFALMPGRIL